MPSAYTRGPFSDDWDGSGPRPHVDGPFSDNWVPTDPRQLVHAYPVTYEQALKGDHAEDVDPAVTDEFLNMDKFGVFTAENQSDMTSEEIQSSLNPGMYITQKTNATTGSYDRTKARLHVGGHRQWSDHFADTASFMVNIMVVFFTIKMMSARGWLHAVYDIKGA